MTTEVVTPKASKGCKLEISNMLSPEVWEEVTGIQDIDGPDLGGFTEIDATHHQSDGKEYVADVPDHGDITFDLVVDTTNDGQIDLEAACNLGTPFRFRQTLTDAGAKVMIYSAIVKTFRLNNAVSGVVKASVALRVTGSIAVS